MPRLTTSEILALPIKCDDVPKAKTVADYLKALLAKVWEEGEGFSGKRPFGNSGWENDLFIPLVKAGVIEGEMDPEEPDQLLDVDSEEGCKVIAKVIKEMTLNG